MAAGGDGSLKTMNDTSDRDSNNDQPAPTGDGSSVWIHPRGTAQAVTAAIARQKSRQRRFVDPS
jgi:hypothetical protein